MVPVGFGGIIMFPHTTKRCSCLSRLSRVVCRWMVRELEVLMVILPSRAFPISTSRGDASP